MQITGGCHCRNIELQLDWPDGKAVRARVCDCDFCTRHGAAWISSPSARLQVSIRDRSLVKDYRFGSGTALFRICAVCGVVPCVTCAIDDALYAVVNVNTLAEPLPSQVERASISFEGEELVARLSRRKRNWIGDVHIRERTAQPSVRGP